MLCALEGFGVDLVHVLGSRRPRREPRVLGGDLETPDWCAVSGRLGHDGGDRLAGEFGRAHLRRRQLGQHRLLLPRRGGVDARIGALAVPLGQFPIPLRRRLPGHRKDFRREQRQDDAVLVGRPRTAVEHQERCPGALLTTERDTAVEQTVDEPLEANRHLQEPAADACDHSVDQRRRDQRLADGRALRPAGPVREQIVDRHGEIVIRVHQAAVGSDDAMAVGVGVVAGGDVVMLARGDQGGHRVRRGAVHPDLAVGVEGHERERRVDRRIHHRQVFQVVAETDAGPVPHRRTTERIGTDVDARLPNHIEVDHLTEAVAVVHHEREVMHVIPGTGLLERDSTHIGQFVRQDLIGARGHHRRDGRISRTTTGRVVLEPTVARRVVRRRHDDAVGQHTGVVAVERQDRAADRGGRRERVPLGGVGADLVGGQHLERGAPRRDGERVGVETDEQGPGDPGATPIFDDRLRRREDVRLVERVVQARPAMPRRPEQHLLKRIRGVGHVVVVGALDRGHIDEVFGQCRSAGSWMRHGWDSATDRSIRPVSRHEHFV